mmetsp:Transcript_6266/g.9103  ORF Transcript_6266/g.9103 Transcript_6266/m.9103 type:complete len:431 (+) Transcript_6266:74-1366(+)
MFHKIIMLITFMSGSILIGSSSKYSNSVNAYFLSSAPSLQTRHLYKRHSDTHEACGNLHLISSKSLKCRLGKNSLVVKKSRKHDDEGNGYANDGLFEEEDEYFPEQDLQIVQRKSSTLPSSTSYSEVRHFGNNIKRDDRWVWRSQKWVVIVDDEEVIRAAVGMYLFERGYQVTACVNGDSALRLCMGIHDNDAVDTLIAGGSSVNSMSINQQQKQQQEMTREIVLPDAVVSDIRMPVMDGIEFLERFRSNNILAPIPFILLTAKGMTDDRIKGYEAGADVYLPKPFDPEELISILDNVIERREYLNGNDVDIDDLKKDLDEIKALVLEDDEGIGNANMDSTFSKNTPNNLDSDLETGLDNNINETFLLSSDELNVLELLCQGLMNKEIASELMYSIRRVEQHLTNMYRKTGCSNRTELVRFAVSNDYVKL